jgi:glycosyltransferase involved in cell wall biosynthesis
MKILLINQCFYPDVVSTAQHLTDLAVELNNRGHEVTVIAGRRGYDNPGRRFAKHEVWNGITIHRVSGTGLGKRARWRRAIDFASFLSSCAIRIALIRRVDLVVVMTSPPMISFLVAVIARLKRWRFAFWVMDMNPDEAIAAGWLREGSAPAKALTSMSRYRLRRAERIIVLDTYMKQRILDKGITGEKVFVIPPWSHDEIRYDRTGREKFRRKHNLSEKYVVMYSGNHSPCHPLNTLLESARSLSSRSDVAFCFVGGGSELQRVTAFAAQHNLNNILTLPYQALGELAGSLSAADLHVVVMGDPFVGIIHPCKIYNILSIGTPILYIGPPESHVTEIISPMENGEACIAAHGDVGIVTQYIIGRASPRRGESNELAPRASAQAFSKGLVVPRLIETLEGICEAPAHYPSAVADPNVELASASRSSGET